MRKQESISTFSSASSESNYYAKKESLLDQFIIWFRKFLDNN
ncbi:hypothetical protein [Polaribacter glomeratus]|nr:hypothetical protein [Polaribacter glomeratus]